MSGATVHWAQRAGTVYLTWEYVAAKDVQVKLSEKSISFSATVGDKQLAMIDMELSGTVVPAESKWFANDRSVQAILKKASSEWWDKLNADKAFKPFVKPDWSRWVEEDDPEYNGRVNGIDFTGSGGDWADDVDSDDDDVPLDDMDVKLPEDEQ